MNPVNIHIRKTYAYGSNIAHVIEYEQELDISPERPKLKQATQSAAEAKTEVQKLARETELEQNKLDYKTEKDKYDKREIAYANNKTKLAGLLLEKCSESMLIKLKEEYDYKVLKDDPVKLVKAIKKTCISYNTGDYDMSQACNALEAFVNTKQKADERVDDYKLRLRARFDILKDTNGN